MNNRMIVFPIIAMSLILTACAGTSTKGQQKSGDEFAEELSEAAADMSEAVSDLWENSKEEVDEKESEYGEDEGFSLNSSSDKHIQYVDKYVGMNAASVGYTSLGGDRMERIGDGLLEITYVTEDGSYVGPEDEDALKEYVVVAQSIEPNAEVRLEFEKDSNGEEYSSLIDHQTYDKIDLLVKKVGESDPNVTLTEIQPSPDKYTYYIQDYVGKNVLSIGYESLGGDFRDEYGNGSIELKLVSDDGSYIDVSDDDLLKQYVVTDQNVAPNSELTYVYSKDSSGNEYSNLIASQNYDSVTLKVKKVTGGSVASAKEKKADDKAEEKKSEEADRTEKEVEAADSKAAKKVEEAVSKAAKEVEAAASKAAKEVETAVGKSSGSETSGTGGGYETIYNTYSQKIKDKAGEYKSAAAGQSIDKKAEISSAKIEEMAEICNKGVQEMADYGLKNGNMGDYTEWGEKLYEVYYEQSEVIWDEYMDGLF